MQDWNYLNSNAFEITVELGCWKYPTVEHLAAFWEANKRPLMAFMLETHKGVKGFVVDQEGHAVPDATVQVEGIPHTVFSAADGDYWRLLVPGEYRVSVFKKGTVHVQLLLMIHVWLNELWTCGGEVRVFNGDDHVVWLC